MFTVDVKQQYNQSIELISVKQSGRSGDIDTFSLFYKVKVYYVFSLESPYRGDSNKYTQYTIFNT